MSDLQPYINRSSFFKQLEDEEYFKTVRVSLGSIQWKNGQDLLPHTLYITKKVIDCILFMSLKPQNMGKSHLKKYLLGK